MFIPRPDETTEKFNTFKLFIRLYLSGEIKVKYLIDNILSEAHNLLNDIKSKYELDKTYFAVIWYLTKQEPEYFKALDITKITDSDYEKILEILNNRTVN